MAQPTDGDRIVATISQEYPYPLAATYQRTFRQVSGPIEAHDNLLDLFELALKYCAAIALSQYLTDRRGDARINESLQNLQRPSLGHWLGWLRDILALYRREGWTFSVPELAAFCNEKTAGELATAMSALRQLMVDRMGYEGTDRGATTTTPLQFFQLLVEYRNRLAHGVHPSNYERKQVADILKPALRALFQSMESLANYRLVYVRLVEVDDDPRSGALQFAHHVTNLTGISIWESENPQLSAAHARKERLYLLDKTGDFRPLLSLHPLLIFRHCDNCNREQVFVLNQGGGVADFISYQCGHHFRPTEYLDDMRSLLQDLDGASGSGSPTIGAPEPLMDEPEGLVTTTPAQIAAEPAAPSVEDWPTAIAETAQSVEKASPPRPVAQPPPPASAPVPRPEKARPLVETAPPGAREATAPEPPTRPFPAPTIPTTAPAIRGPRKSPGLAIALSILLLGGGGHFYAGEIWKGLGLIFLLIVAVIVDGILINSHVLPEWLAVSLLFLGPPVYIVFAARDASRTIKRLNARNGW